MPICDNEISALLTTQPREPPLSCHDYCHIHLMWRVVLDILSTQSWDVCFICVSFQLYGYLRAMQCANNHFDVHMIEESLRFRTGVFASITRCQNIKNKIISLIVLPY